ncbi:hypothetical protein [Intestinibacter sp.]|uniref:hypothetical protein n=1 Tax=Intestinibacter sp. TaxID=1965304 RepID=UPI002A91F6FA|nr:hypothetical protein [Intestinibacter sp.]MDY5213327.1 hypothetical protein [Intestinibacter sp.]
MFKNKSLIIAALVVIVMGTISIFYFGKPVENKESYNIIAINNTGEDIKSIGYETEKQSGDVINADNSMIKNKEEIYLDVEGSKFKMSITDKYDKKFLSQEMTIDLNKDKKYEVSIEKDKNNKYTFEIRETWRK